MKEEGKKIPSASGLAMGSKGAYGIGRGGPDANAFVAWALVGIPFRSPGACGRPSKTPRKSFN